MECSPLQCSSLEDVDKNPLQTLSYAAEPSVNTKNYQRLTLFFPINDDYKKESVNLHFSATLNLVI